MRCLISGLSAALYILATGSAGLASDIVCDPHGCIKVSTFSTNIYNTLNKKVVGFAILVGGWFPYYGGWARTATDSPKTAMGGEMDTNIASVSKVLTTIGVLQSMSAHKLTLDDKIWPYLYPDWRKHAGPNIDTITFHDLMTHRSGFRVDCTFNHTTYAYLKEQITTGVTLSDKAKPSYNNCNFAIFRELLPSMEGHPVSGSDTSRAAQSADFYIDYMNSHVFKRAGLSTRACKPPAAAQTVLSYSMPAGSSHGRSWGDWKLACGGGGWVLSPQDLLQILNQLINGNHLLADGDKSRLLAPPPNCIAWDCAQGAECPNPYVCKTGLLQSGDVVLQTYIGIFKCSTPVVVIINSAHVPTYTGGILGMVRDAYNAAKVAGKPRACPSSS